MTGNAIKVTHNGVYFETCQPLPEHCELISLGKNIYFVKYDYLVIGTGCTCWNIMSVPKDNNIKFINPCDANSLLSSHKFISEAPENQEIVVLGGGFVGTEIAGALGEKYPNRTVRLIHRSQRLLKPSEDAHHAAMEIFKSDMPNVKVMLETEIIGQTGPNTFQLKRKEEREETPSLIDCAVCFICTGMSPQSKLMAEEFKPSLDANGFVNVNPHMQVSKDENTTTFYDNIYAIGDVTNMPETKLATCANKHGKIACTVLQMVCQWSEKSTYPSYTPGDMNIHRVSLWGHHMDC